jgi:hypothetical protein
MKRFLGFTALAIATLLSQAPAAQAHIGFGDDYECSESYSKDCWVKGNSQRILRLTFRGTEAELGPGCTLQTQKLGNQIPKVEQLAGVERGAIEYTRPHVSFSGGTGQQTHLTCHYEIRSTRQDLRFVVKNVNTRYWTNRAEQAGVCMDDVRQAEAIPGSLGAGRSMSASLTQGEMCSSIYAIAGIDKVGKDTNGNPRIIKFGTREHDLMERGVSDGIAQPFPMGENLH